MAVILNTPPAELATMVNRETNLLIDRKNTQGDAALSDLNFWALKLKEIAEEFYEKGVNRAIVQYGVDVETGVIERPHSKADVVAAWHSGNNGEPYENGEAYYTKTFETGM